METSTLHAIPAEAAYLFLRDHVQQHRDSVIPLALAWLDRASLHLQTELDTYLRDGHVPPKTEDQAKALLRLQGQHLSDASNELAIAADALRSAGKPSAANRAYRAHMHIRQQAEALR